MKATFTIAAIVLVALLAYRFFYILFAVLVAIMLLLPGDSPSGRIFGSSWGKQTDWDDCGLRVGCWLHRWLVFLFDPTAARIRRAPSLKNCPSITPSLEV